MRPIRNSSCSRGNSRRFTQLDAKVIRPKSMRCRRNMTNSEQQFAKDCSAEYLNVPPTLSPKCADESKKLGEAWNRLQAERAKQ